MGNFTVVAKDAATATLRQNPGHARTGVLRTAHGDIPTPCFMPIGTIGAVKHVMPTELRATGADIILSNTYHLALRPGTKFLAQHGGLHRFMRWDGPILTDSGGFQVFSLGARERPFNRAQGRRGGENLVRLDEDGVTFRSHIDGSAHRFTPESVMEHQRNIGSDIAMVLDVCPPQPCSREELQAAVERTTRWAERAKRAKFQEPNSKFQQLVFGIVQGGSDEELRRESAGAITEIGFDGYAIGGVAVGEEKDAIRAAIELTAPLLPDDKPRYLMGLGTPDDIVHAVAQGVDMFDCVLPTRDGRHGRVYARVSGVPCSMAALARERQGFYTRFDLTAAAQRDRDEPIDQTCACVACVHFSRAYLRHCFAIGEPLGQRLATIHNLTFYLTMMRELREGIIRGAV